MREISCWPNKKAPRQNLLVNGSNIRIIEAFDLFSFPSLSSPGSKLASLGGNGVSGIGLGNRPSHHALRCRTWPSNDQRPKRSTMGIEAPA